MPYAALEGPLFHDGARIFCFSATSKAGIDSIRPTARLKTRPFKTRQIKTRQNREFFRSLFRLAALKAMLPQSNTL